METETEKMSGAGVSISIYVGSNEEGMRNKRLILDHARVHGMKRSEYILFCVQEQIKREGEAQGDGTKKTH